MSAPPARARKAVPGHTIATYQARRDFDVTSEPAPQSNLASAKGNAPIFVVQKHDASRLHWDFRLEHDGVLWSWAVPRGPSLDPHDKRLAVHVEDHPLEYADFHGEIPEGQYGAGTVETWDRGTWEPMGDPAADLAKGEMKFALLGKRLQGHFVLIRLKPRPKERAENWLLIKEHDEHEQEGGDAAALEQAVPAPKPAGQRRVYGETKRPAPNAAPPASKPPARTAATKQPKAGSPPPGAVPAAMPAKLAPQLATLVDEAPGDDGWLSEVKFDGYRMLAFVEDDKVRMITRNGLDWTHRFRAVADAVSKLGIGSAILDGEVVALKPDGISDFGKLQQALSDGKTDGLYYYLFDIPYLRGCDLRACKLADRKAALQSLADWKGAVRYSDHVANDAGRMRRSACAMGLEGIICKQADAPYRSGRGSGWVKVKCQGREEFVILGYTAPGGSRTGFGALQVGYYDAEHRLHYAGAVGTGFSQHELRSLTRRLESLKTDRPAKLLYAGDPIDRSTVWVRPELIAEVQYLTWTGGGRLRHPAFLGLREDKSAEEIVRDIPEPETPRREFGKPSITRVVATAPKASRPAPKASASAKTAAATVGTSTAAAAVVPPARSTVVARSPKHAGNEEIDGVRVTHPDRALWPGITKHDLAAYWQAVSAHALPEIAGRPLALVRCPEGYDGEHFFQKHAKPGFPSQIRAGEADGAPYLAIDDEAGLVAAAQVSAIEIHAWGASGDDPLHPDRLVFDLDPGEGIGIADLVKAAIDVRDRLKVEGLAAFCRTSGGKGLHVVVPLKPKADWDTARAWSRAFAERMEAESGELYVASVPKARRRGKILIDWLRNGLGSTAIASFSPRAREGAGVATRLDWKEVTPKLDPAGFNIRTVPDRLKRQKRDPWAEFAGSAKPLPTETKSLTTKKAKR